MKYKELPIWWQRIFELEWQSICEGSKAIAAVIVDENGEIVSEGRNQISECTVPNPATAHAEAEAIRNLDVSKYPNPKKYTLYAGLEPCIMCMGTLVMGHIRNVVIAARDDFGGAMNLIDCSKFAKSKGIQITFLDDELGDMQRAFQTIRELLYSPDNDKRKFMLHDFSVYNKVGVIAAKGLVESGYFEGRALTEMSAEEVFDELMGRFAYGDSEIIDLFLFMGQSNMAGRGITSEKWPEKAPALTEGAGWEFRAISDPTKLYPITEPFGVDENNPEGIYDVFSSEEKAKTGSMVTAFVNAYYAKTGIPIVGVSASKGGSRIAQWLPDAGDGFLKDALGRYCKAVEFLTDAMRYQIRHRYMLWCQGESDGDKGTTAEEYKERFHIIWQEMKAVGIEKCFLIKTGKKNVSGQEDDYEEIRRAQEELCDGEEVIMVSRSLGEMLERGLMKDAFHYFQQAYNEVGAEAGTTVGDFVKTR